MMKALGSVAAVAALSLLVGCFDSSSNKGNRLSFENASSYRVTVHSLTTEWGGFHIDPGERVRLEKIRDVDWRYEPVSRVMEGSASSTRNVVFVNRR